MMLSFEEYCKALKVIPSEEGKEDYLTLLLEGDDFGTLLIKKELIDDTKIVYRALSVSYERWFLKERIENALENRL